MNIESFVLPEHDWVPNNPRLPVLVYRGAVAAGDCEEAAKAFETAFEKNGWSPQWRDGVYDYHHYHSTAHEALDRRRFRDANHRRPRRSRDQRGGRRRAGVADRYGPSLYQDERRFPRRRRLSARPGLGHLSRRPG